MEILDIAITAAFSVNSRIYFYSVHRPENEESFRVTRVIVYRRHLRSQPPYVVRAKKRIRPPCRARDRGVVITCQIRCPTAALRPLEKAYKSCYIKASPLPKFSRTSRSWHHASARGVYLRQCLCNSDFYYRYGNLKKSFRDGHFLAENAHSRRLRHRTWPSRSSSSSAPTPHATKPEEKSEVTFCNMDVTEDGEHEWVHNDLERVICSTSNCLALCIQGFLFRLYVWALWKHINSTKQYSFHEPLFVLLKVSTLHIEKLRVG